MVSILMPVHNTAQYLPACLDSILNQTFRDWELIAINDHSTDNSKQILEKYARKDPRIRWYSNDQKGIIPALKKAAQYSQGEMVHRMDSDDLMPIDKLEKLHQKLVESGRGSVVTGMVRYFSTDQELKQGFIDYGNWINKHIVRDTIFEDIFIECPIASPAWLMYREDLDRIGGITDGIYPEDYDLVFRMYVHGLTPKGISSVIHHWRDWPKRASRTKKEYKDQLFFDLKVRYFLKYKYRPEDKVVIWGAGRKGKKLFRRFQKFGIRPAWVTENTKKVGHVIYGTTLSTPEGLLHSSRQVIVAISNPGARADIRRRMEKRGLVNNTDIFFFC